MAISPSKIIELSEQAGKILLEHYFLPPESSVVTTKPDDSPLTDADLQSHEFLCGELKSLNPAIAIVSEEGLAGSQSDSEPFWLVDPLDGTREFIRRRPEFTINIALVENQAPVLGVIHVPMRGVTYYAEKNGGAFLKDSTQKDKPIHCRTYSAQNALGFASQTQGGKEEARVKKLWPEMQIEPMASAIKYCLIAEGKADFYVREHICMAWDTAAAQIILEEAGGALLWLDGNPLRYHRNQLTNRPFVAVGDKTFPWRRYLGPTP